MLLKILNNINYNSRNTSNKCKRFTEYFIENIQQQLFRTITKLQNPEQLHYVFSIKKYL